MKDDFEILDAAPKLGGRREGAGRKSKEFEDRVQQALDDEGELSYSVARARKEAWQAKMAELDFNIKSKQYVARDAVRQACATAYASIVQALRSIPDSLERREGVSPEVAERVGIVIDEALADLSSEFEMFSGE